MPLTLRTATPAPIAPVARPVAARPGPTLTPAAPSPSVPPIAVHVSPGSAEGVARTRASLARQSWTAQRDGSVARDDDRTEAYVALIAAGTVLAPHTLERAWWFLDTHPEVGFVTGVDSRIAPADRPRALAAGLAVFVVARRALVPQPAALVAGEPLVPGLLAAITCCTLGGTGHVLGDPTHQHDPDDAFAARLAVVGPTVPPSALTSMGELPPATRPLQRIATAPLPDVPVPLAPVAPGRQRVLALFLGFPMGGYATFNADLVPRLVARGHAVTVCTTEWWRTTHHLDKVLAATDDVHHAAGLVPPEQLPRFLDWLVTSRQVEVLFVSQSFAALRCLDWLRARHPGLAIIDYPKTDWFEEGMYGSYAEMSAAYTHAVDLHLVTSDALGRDLMARGVDAARVRTCYLNLDLAVWDPSRHRSGEVRASLGAPPDAVLLLYAARVSAEKRPLMTLDILAALRAEGHPVHLLVAGAGAMLPTMVEAAQARGLAAHCTFLGELDEASLRFVYANADLYCVPSSIEGIARTLYEALAMGLPVVAADVGGQRELAVPEVGGCIAPGPDELVRWVAAVRRLLDPAVRAAASRAARQRMEALHGVDRLVAVIEAAFDDAMTVRRTRPAVVPAPVAAEVALMGMEIARRHVRAALDRQGSGRG